VRIGPLAQVSEGSAGKSARVGRGETARFGPAREIVGAALVLRRPDARRTAPANRSAGQVVAPSLRAIDFATGHRGEQRKTRRVTAESGYLAPSRPIGSMSGDERRVTNAGSPLAAPLPRIALCSWNCIGSPACYGSEAYRRDPHQGSRDECLEMLNAEVETRSLTTGRQRAHQTDYGRDGSGGV